MYANQNRNYFLLIMRKKVILVFAKPNPYLRF
jgi:hypothetical protein